MLRRAWTWAKRHGWKVYLVALAASWAWQGFFPAAKPPPPEGGRALETPRFTRNGVEAKGTAELAYRDTGPPLARPDAPVIVLIHGSPGESGNFDYLIPLLEQRFRVVAVDLPGFGASSRFVPSYATRAHARYVWFLLDTLGIRRPHVLGFSLGSGVALEMNDLAPGRVDSLIFYGGVGIQEGEGSGDYHFEHLKYTLGFPFLVALPELVPHFGHTGFLGTVSQRYAFLRNFNDTDQRPMRGYLHEVDAAGLPMLILHGRHDPLVPARTAEEHHEIVRRSELVMFDASHFMLFQPDTAGELAEEMIPFVERDSRGESAAELPEATRRTVYRPGAEEPPPTVLPVDLELYKYRNPWLKIGAIMVGSYVLEDPTTIAVGLLVRDGQLDAVLALLALFTGIFTGDLALYLVGRVFGARVLSWKPVAKRLPAHHVDALAEWFDTHGWGAVLVSRFVPGSRTPLYIAAGAIGRRPGRFALWTCLAVAVWAPVMLVLVVVVGEAASSPFRLLFGKGWLAVVAALVLLVVAVRLMLYLGSTRGRQKLRVLIGTYTRREFRPPWLFYLPLVPVLVWLAVRYRSFTVWTLADPGLPDGGVVGESKAAILAELEGEPAEPASAAGGDERGPDATGDARPTILSGVLVTDAADARRVMAARGWSLPLILKPDAAQRGVGVRLIRRDAELDRFFVDPTGPTPAPSASPTAALLQRYHPGPFEAGVFYVRHPCEETGRIFSVTDKHFPVILGDGRHTLEQLIWRHPRYLMQAHVFMQRHEERLGRVLADGETLRLAEAGNHCQGTRFTDGSHLITPQLTTAIDALARRLDRFYFGRFDIRYADAEAFKRGEGFAVIEVNGVTSESTNVYDPGFTFRQAYGTLAEQWKLCFAIGEANRVKYGLTPPRLIPLLRRVRRYYKTRYVDPVSD